MSLRILSMIIAGGLTLGGCSLFQSKPAPRRAAASPTACDEGDVEACHELGLVLKKKQGDPAAKERALGYFRLACQRGHAPACVELKKEHEAACGRAQPKSCHALAEWYHYGNKAVSPDLVKARRYYKAACTDGVARSCYRLGVMWLQGKGGGVSELRGKYYLGEACKGKHAQACARLGK